MTILHRQILHSAPRHARSLSLFDNVKKILSRSTPPSPLPSEPAKEEIADTKKFDKVGAHKTSKIIGFQLNVPRRLYGTELTNGLQHAFKTVCGAEEADIKQSDKLKLVREILKTTGQRVPDFVLNSSTTTADIQKYFAKQEQASAGRVIPLQLDESRLPSNVKLTS